jgi:MinD superfamily P-loop ATPase
MKIAIASGKGGTGKTTVAVNLAVTAARGGAAVTYFDCDVEEPNGHIFLRPDITETSPVRALVPVVDNAMCTRCGECGRICRFSAIVSLGGEVLTFHELCHHCGGCALVCPAGAISEEEETIGELEEGAAGAVRFVHARLGVGVPTAPPVVRAVKKRIGEGLSILDSPPGTSCPVVETVRDADFAALVTEPTPFGLNDLRLAVDMLRVLGVPFGVVINRAGSGDLSVYEYCREEEIDVLAEIPDRRRIAEMYSRGEILVEEDAVLADIFKGLLAAVTRRGAGKAGRGGAS